MERITIAYIAHDEQVYNKYLKPSIENLNTKYDLVCVNSKYGMPAENYNRMIRLSKDRFILFVHEDTTFGPDFLDNIYKTISLHPNFGAIGAVGQLADKSYVWSRPQYIKQVQVLDCCCILINKEHAIKFDHETFNEYHCYVEDYCMQANSLGFKNYTIPLFASEASILDNYTNELGYFKHHSNTVRKLGYCWGNYWSYNKIMNDKWS